jgi:hypothetical protein
MHHTHENVRAWYITIPIYNYVAMTKDRKRFTTFTEKQLGEYTETTIYRICRTPQPIQEINEHQPCEVQLFKGPEVIPTKYVIEKCTLQRNIYHRLQGKNT